MTSLVGVILRWRENKAAFIGDIRKMFNLIHISEQDQHCHRFLWRGMNADKSPDTYVMTHVIMGDRPAPAISSKALKMMAEIFQEEHPNLAKLLQSSVYFDDIVGLVSSEEADRELANETKAVLLEAGFRKKVGNLVKPMKAPIKYEF